MRISIVNDVAVTCEALRRIVMSEPGDRVAWIAGDGEDAVERCRLDTPDLILMELMLPRMDGAEATRRIMAQTPCPILVVTSTVEGRVAKVFEALGAGAFDAVQTPVFGGSRQQQGIAALRVKIDAIRRLVFDGAGRRQKDTSAPGGVQPGSSGRDRLVALGSSAGGPTALASILSGLPRDFAAAVVIVQHVDAQFVPFMASWLNAQSAIPVRVAHEGDQPRANEALIAGTNDHLVFVDSRSLGYSQEPRDAHQRPSIDTFFESIVRHWRGEVAAVLLTGMGRDGARGLKTLRDAGFLTIAQDSATSAVYGMPKAAAELGGAARILPIEGIAQGLMDFATLRNRPR